MTQPSVSTFLDVVEKSGLVAKSRLAQSIADLERDSGKVTDSRVVSSHLTNTGLLTNWQCDLLLEGRHRGFFVGKYKLLDHLGTGGMSAVYLAEHVVMRRRVAVKVLPAQRVNDTSYLARFHREARAAAALDHPNIVRAFDVDNEKDTHYLVMEYVEGRDLKETVEQVGPLPYDVAAEYIRQAAEGLAHAHQAGLIHRDMKPANLLIDKNGTVKVLDMGLARFADDVEASLTKEHDEKMLGTVDYLAPEQALNAHEVDHRVDIYSLGCTLYFTLTGHPPFPTGTLAHRVMYHQTQEPASIYMKRPDAPPDLVAICRRMMAKSADARYQSAADVSNALAQWLKFYQEMQTRLANRGPETPEIDLELAPLEEESARQSAAPQTSKATPPGTGPAKSPAPLRTAAAEGQVQTRTVEKTSSTARRSREMADTDTVKAGQTKASDSDAKRAPKTGSDIKKTGSDVKKTDSRYAATDRPLPVAVPLKAKAADAATEAADLESIHVPRALGDLLADIDVEAAASSSGKNRALGGTLMAHGLTGTMRQVGKPRTRWESPWFLMLVGAGLAAVPLVVWLVVQLLKK